MAIVPVMWTVWGVFAVITAALYLYRTSLTRDEEDQIFLDESFDQEKTAQEAIVARVNKLEPYLRVVLWLAVASTVFVVGYYVLDIVNRLK
jgi:predicted transcriptional regulator